MIFLTLCWNVYSSNLIKLNSIKQLAVLTLCASAEGPIMSQLTAFGSRARRLFCSSNSSCTHAVQNSLLKPCGQRVDNGNWSDGFRGNGKRKMMLSVDRLLKRAAVQLPEFSVNHILRSALDFLYTVIVTQARARNNDTRNYLQNPTQR